MTINLLNACSFLHINWMVKQYLTIVLFRSLCHRFTGNYLHVDWIWFLLFHRLLLYTLCATANTRQNPHIDSDYRKHRHNILCAQNTWRRRKTNGQYRDDQSRGEEKNNNKKKCNKNFQASTIFFSAYKRHKRKYRERKEHCKWNRVECMKMYWWSLIITFAIL